MDSIQREVYVNYHKPSIQDIITMIPVMDELAADYRTYNKWIEEKQEDESTKKSYVNKANRIYNQLCILQQLGFSTSNNNKEIEPPKEIDI